MFELVFKNEIIGFTSDAKQAQDLWQEVQKQYSKSGRYYHNLSHLDNLLEELQLVKNEISDWETIIFSIAYHDIIYNPLKKDNEERSAGLAFTRLGSINVPSQQAEKCKQQILATKSHALSDDMDTNYFTDADLSILGAPPSRYKVYTEQIRREYKYFPDLLYNPGRKKVLTHFLEMPAIFKTVFFRDKFELPARGNIAEELKGLG